MSTKKTRVVTGMIMPGGWHMPHQDRAGRPLPQPLRADTFWDLVDAVRQFRADNTMPIGDVQTDVENYICETFPTSCVQRGARVSVKVTQGAGQTDSTQPLTDRMVAWMDSRLNNHTADRMVTDADARQRAEICRKCQMNVKWNTSCGACADVVGRLGVALRMGKDAPGGKRLFACKVLAHENRSAVWLDRSLIETSPQLPAHCWAK